MAASPGDENADRTGLIQILTWFLFLVGFFSLCARLGSKMVMSIRFTWDDWLALAAKAVLLVQAITLSIGATNGLGKPLHTLPEDEMRIALQAEYAYIPLFLLALAMIKWSLSVYIGQITHKKKHRLMNNAIAVMVGLWLVPAILVGLFQCDLPSPWNILNPGKCINREAWWTYVTVINITGEIGFVAIYISIFRGLQTSTVRKASVLGVFSARLLVAVASGAQLATFLGDQPTVDRSYNGWLPILCNQIVACLSMSTACLPYFRPFMQSIEFGVIQVNEDGSQEELSQRPQRQTAASRSRAQGISGTSGSGSGSGSRPQGKKRASSSGFFGQLSQMSHPAAVRLSSSPEPEQD